MKMFRLALLFLCITGTPGMAAAQGTPQGSVQGDTVDSVADQLATKVIMEWAFQKKFQGSVLEILIAAPDLALDHRIGWGLALRKPVMDRALAASTLQLAARLTEASAREPLQPAATIKVAGIEARVQNEDYVRSMNRVELLLNSQVTPEIASSIIDCAKLPEMSEVLAAHQHMKAVLTPAIASNPEFVQTFLTAKQAAMKVATEELIKSREAMKSTVKQAAAT